MTTKAKKTSPQIWGANYFIAGYGHVKQGYRVSKEALEAWKAIAPKGCSPKVSNE